MSLFEERERAFELMFAYDEEMRFRALARRNCLFASWAAEHLGLSGDERENYLRAMVKAVVVPENEERLIERVREDLSARGCPATEQQIRRAMAQARETAARQIKEEAFEAPLAVAR